MKKVNSMKKSTVGTISLVLSIIFVLFYMKSAHAGQYTLPLTDTYETSNGQTVCIYGNSIHSESVVIEGHHCPNVMTFED